LHKRKYSQQSNRINSDNQQCFDFERLRTEGPVKELYNEFKKLSHEEIFKYIMQSKDELTINYMNAQTELIMLRKYWQENSPLKYSKEKYEFLERDYQALK